MKPKATIVIPWRPSPSRLAAYTRVREFWDRYFPRWPVITADSETEIFSLSQARNAGVKLAQTDVVIIADADTLIDPANILTAVADPAGVWWPFEHYRIYGPEHLTTPLENLADTPHLNTWDGDGIAGVGGAIVTTRQEYWRLGGQPPEFVGWGWEDVAFTLIARTLSQVRRLPGCVYAFEHNTGGYLGGRADTPGWDRDISRNQPLLGYYRCGDGRPWLMRELIKQRTTTSPSPSPPPNSTPAAPDSPHPTTPAAAPMSPATSTPQATPPMTQEHLSQP